MGSEMCIRDSTKTMYKFQFFVPEYKTFLFRPRVFSRALGCGARRGPACVQWCKCGFRPGSVARALGVQSREIWQVIAGLRSDQLEPTRSMQPPKYFLLVLHFASLSAAVREVPQQLLKARQPRSNSRDSSFFLGDSHEQCMCMCVRVSL